MLRRSRHAALLLTSESLVQQRPLELLTQDERVWGRVDHLGNLLETEQGSRAIRNVWRTQPADESRLRPSSAT